MSYSFSSQFGVQENPRARENDFTVMNNLHPAPTWQALYQKALAETDLDKLLPLVMAADNAMFDRSQELVSSFDGEEERQAINHPIRTLRTIQVEKLTFPE
jgi:hypothetical protein